MRFCLQVRRGTSLGIAPGMASSSFASARRRLSYQSYSLILLGILLLLFGVGIHEHWEFGHPQWSDSSDRKEASSLGAVVAHDLEDTPRLQKVHTSEDMSIVREHNKRAGSTGTPFAKPSFCGYRMEYHPSKWESYWHENIGALQSQDNNWKVACDYIAKWEKEKVAEYERMWNRRQFWTLKDILDEDWDKDLFSYHAMIDNCSNNVTMRIPIEPLVGALRHPAYPCFRNKRHNKNWIFTTYDFEFEPHGFGFRKYLFDLGASLYDAGPGGASQHWFVDTYKARGIEFDRILGWEVKPHSDPQIYEGMPQEIVDVMSYYNLPADTGTNAKHNPLRIMRSIATVQDFVVVKIDIDHSATEMALVQEILEDNALSALIDELYFEHHVMMSPMNACCWRYNNQGDVKSSHELFAKLRRRGIRAHSWV